MRTRRLVPVAAALAVATLATFGCAEQSAGVRVGDAVVSEASIVDELDAYGNNEALFAAAGGSEAIRGDLRDSYQQSFVGDLVEQRIIFMLSEQIFDDEGLELSDADRQQAQDSISSQMTGFDDFPSDYQSAFVDDVARTNLLSDELGQEGFNAALLEKASSTDIEVSSRFGVWNADTLALEPPPGPAATAGDTSGGGEPLPTEPTG